MRQKLFLSALVLTAIGFCCFGVLYLFDIAAPDVLFTVLTLAFLIMIALALVCLLIWWVLLVRDKIKERRWLEAGLILLFGAFIFIYNFCIRYR